MTFDYTNKSSFEFQLKQHALRAIVKSRIISDSNNAFMANGYLSPEELDERKNENIFVAVHGLDGIELSPRSIQTHFQMLLCMYNNEDGGLSFKRKMDKKAGLNQPTYGELVWHVYGWDTHDLKDQLNPIYMHQYDCRHGIHQAPTTSQHAYGKRFLHL